MTCTGRWPLKVFVLLGMKTRTSPHTPMKGDCAASCRVAEEVLENGLLLQTVAVMPGSGFLAKERVHLSENRGQWVEGKLTGSLDTLGDQRNCPVILRRRK